jgi:predicted ABC-type ATPase
MEIQSKETVSREMEQILSELDLSLEVDFDRIQNTPEIVYAELSSSILEIQCDGKYQISSEEIVEKGNALLKKENNIIEHNKRLDIVIGPPASGKSSLLVDKIATRYHSRVIDNDDIKTTFPFYMNGIGANCVHEASQMVADFIYLRAMDHGDNIVLPKLGRRYEKLLSEYIDTAFHKGYTIYIHYVEASKAIATKRILRRYIDTGRYVPLQILINCYNGDHCTIEDSYNMIKKNPSVSGFSKWNTDNCDTLGQPELIENKGDIEIYAL